MFFSAADCRFRVATKLEFEGGSRLLLTALMMMMIFFHRCASRETDQTAQQPATNDCRRAKQRWKQVKMEAATLVLCIVLTSVRSTVSSQLVCFRGPINGPPTECRLGPGAVGVCCGGGGLNRPRFADDDDDNDYGARPRSSCPETLAPHNKGARSHPLARKGGGRGLEGLICGIAAAAAAALWL